MRNLYRDVRVQERSSSGNIHRQCENEVPFIKKKDETFANIFQMFNLTL